MKISTSLIRIRYAVGVMLALSAVFAVVIGTSTLQPRDAAAHTGHGGNIEVNLSVDDNMLKEGESGNNTAVVTVSLSRAAGTNGVAIPLTVSASTTGTGTTIGTNYSVDAETQDINNDFGATGNVMIASGATSKTITITIHNDTPAAANGTRTITVALGDFTSTADDDPQHGYEKGDDDSVAITVYDEENSAPSGTTIIDHTDPTVGDELTATFTLTNDADGKTMFENGPDGQSGTTGDNNSPVMYQWGHIEQGDNPDTDNVETDFDIFMPISGATGMNMKYTVMASDVTEVLAVRAAFTDDAGFGEDDDNHVQSDATGPVKNSVSIGVDKKVLREGDSNNDTAIVTITLGASAPTGGAMIPVDLVHDGTQGLTGATDDFSVDAEATSIDNDFSSSNGSVEIRADSRTGTLTIKLIDRDDDDAENNVEGRETITVSLGDPQDGYENSETMKSVSIIVHDEENSKPTGVDPIIQTGDPPAPLSGAPAVGQMLTAHVPDFAVFDDLDKKTTFANGPDGDADEAKDNHTQVQYQWVHYTAADDDANPPVEEKFSPIKDATGKTYTVKASDVGYILIARVGFMDDAGFDINTGNYDESVRTEAVENSINLNVDNKMLREGGANKVANIKVTLSAPAEDDVNVPLTFPTPSGTRIAERQTSTTATNDYAVDEETGTIDNDFDGTVTIKEGASSASVIVTVNDDDTDHDNDATTPDQGTAEGTETIRVALGTAPTGYENGSMSSFDITVYDEENSKPTGTTATITGTVTVGGELTADLATLASLADVDGKTMFENGPDDRDATTFDNNSPLEYQWGHIVEGDNPDTEATETEFFDGIDGAERMKYTVMQGDVGKILAVRVGFEDDAGFDIKTGNHIQKAATSAVTNTVTISVDEMRVRVDENTDSPVVTVKVTLTASPPAGSPANIAWTLGGDAVDGTDYIVGWTSPLEITNPHTMGTFQVNIRDDNIAESNETIEITLNEPAANSDYALGSPSSVTITIIDNENKAATGLLVNVGSNPAPMYVTPGTELTADVSGIVDPDGIDTADGATPGFGNDAANTENIDYKWGTLDANGVFDTDGATGTVNARTYTVDAEDGGKTLAVQVSFMDDARDDAASTRVTETLTSKGVKAAVMVTFGGDMAEFDEDDNTYSVYEGDSIDVKVSLSNAPPTDGRTEVTVSATGNMDGSFAMGDKDITLPETLIFDGGADAPMNKEQTITYTAPPDVTGRQEVMLSLRVPDDHMADADATIQIKDSHDHKASGTVTISDTTPEVGDTLTMTVDDLMDINGIDASTKEYVWYIGGEKSDVTGMSYIVVAEDFGKEIRAAVEFDDLDGNFESVKSDRTSPVDRVSSGQLGMISEIKPGIRGITTSGGDNLRLEVEVYGLQGVKDQSLADDADTITWSATGGTISDIKGATARYKTPSAPSTYTITAMVGRDNCRPSDEDMREEKCSAKFEVRVRRPLAPQPMDEAPVDPPGDIPSVIADRDGNQYEVFTPVGGGTFDSGEGYSVRAAAGAVPNGEFIGIRMSDEGAASNEGMTHQRYTLGGNMYAVSAVDGSGAVVSSYALDDPATVCLPLPDALRHNISELAVVAINGDGSLTILSAQVRISSAGTMVCGGLSNLPASLAVGSVGAPAAIPTPTPEPAPELPETGGTAPASSTMVLWALLLSIATLALGSALVISRRRESSVRNR